MKPSHYIADEKMLTGRRADQLPECLLGTRCETIYFVNFDICLFALAQALNRNAGMVGEMRGQTGSGKRLEHKRPFVELERLLSLVMDAWMSRVHVVV